MAQTRKRRRTKHRGNAAGMVESRGRTGRKPGEGEKTSATTDRKELARRKRQEKLDKPPTWRGSLNRAAIAALLFAVAVVVLGQDIRIGVSIAVVILPLYVVMGYYTDLFVYRRRQRKKAGSG